MYPLFICEKASVIQRTFTIVRIFSRSLRVLFLRGDFLYTHRTEDEI